VDSKHRGHFLFNCIVAVRNGVSFCLCGNKEIEEDYVGLSIFFAGLLVYHAAGAFILLAN